MEIDNVDREILNVLLNESRLSYREVSKLVNVSVVTVMNRVKKLEKERIIEKYYSKVNYEKLGFGVHVLIEIRIAKGKLIELEKKIAKSQNVYAVYDTTGEYDATILAKFKSTRAMDNFLKELQTFDFVERTNTKLVLNTIKEGLIRV